MVIMATELNYHLRVCLIFIVCCRLCCKQESVPNSCWADDKSCLWKLLWWERWRFSVCQVFDSETKTRRIVDSNERRSSVYIHSSFYSEQQ